MLVLSLRAPGLPPSSFFHLASPNNLGGARSAREEGRSLAKERETEREREMAQVLHPLFEGLCCPLSSGGGSRRVGLDCNSRRAFRFPSAVLESYVRSRLLKWPFCPFRAAGPLTAAPFGGAPSVGGKAILLDDGTRGQLPGAQPQPGNDEQRPIMSPMQRGGGDLHSRLQGRRTSDKTQHTDCMG